ncbi:MAG: protein kinase [Steroidobacteraceae bacterium]
MSLKIDPTIWPELSRLLDTALDLPAEQRDSWLDSLDAVNDALKPQLRALLAQARVETGDFLRTLPRIDEPALTHGQSSSSAGEIIGPYRLLRQIGSGGMGSVWLAERTDGLMKRPVALKLPHITYDSAKRQALCERMAREREILAALNHPHITTLYDAGVTGTGQPYLALEFVDGEAIDHFCASRKLPVRERLRLFLQVAHAVAYAHGMSVVHRDLKPSNILVTQDGQVQLLDFGVAKLLAHDMPEETQLTELSGRALTPDYASPEQILGAAISTSSDVYSLGVILYELLTDSRPYRLTRDSRGALEEAILQADPPRPSTVADKARRAELSGDLDAIVMTALRKQAGARFATVHAFAEDLERYLANRPVLARPDGRWYRAHKFVARNKLAVAAASGVVLTIVAGAGAALWQARVARQQEQRAEQVKDFITSIFRDADPGSEHGKVLSAPELLRQADQRLRQAPPDDADVAQELRAIIGDSFIGLEENRDAAAVLENALRMDSALYGGHGPLAARLHMSLADAYGYLGRPQDARQQLLLARQSITRDEGLTMATTILLQEAGLALDEARFPDAEHAAKQALANLEKFQSGDRQRISQALQFLSMTYRSTNRPDEAVQTARRARTLMLALHGGNERHPEVIDATMGYGSALVAAGDFQEAQQTMHKAARDAELIFGPEAMMTGFFLAGMVGVETERGELRDAIADAQRSVAIVLKQSEPNSVAHASRVRSLGIALLAARDAKRADRQLSEAIRIATIAHAVGDLQAAQAGSALAQAYLGHPGTARQMLLQVLADSPPDSRSYHQALRYLGTALRLEGKGAAALPWLEKAAAAATRRSHRGDRAQALLESALVQLDLRKVDEAQSLLDSAAAILRELQPGDTPLRADLLVATGRLELLRGRASVALASLQSADAFWRAFDADNRWAGETELWLGRAYLALDRKAEADAALKRARILLGRSALPMDRNLTRLAGQRS